MAGFGNQNSHKHTVCCYFGGTGREKEEGTGTERTEKQLKSKNRGRKRKELKRKAEEKARKAEEKESKRKEKEDERLSRARRRSASTSADIPPKRLKLSVIPQSDYGPLTSSTRPSRAQKRANGVDSCDIDSNQCCICYFIIRR